jgi:isoleucyl-tRNA synthetase
VDREVFDRVTAAIRAKGGDAWYSAEISEFLPRGAACAHCHGTEFRREEDILDVWFDSGVSWAAVLGQRDHTRGVPREDVMYLEGSDQHRGWFQTSLLPALALTGEPPYGQVLTHGFVLDGSGRAMSKSLGNVIAPQELITKFGADVVRLWVAVTDYREDVRLSPDILDRVVDTYRKIRNTLRFLLGNLGDFVPARHAVPMNMMAPLDLAAVRELAGVISFVKEDYQEFSFHTAISRICDEYCISTLSEYYLDVCKDVLYCSQREAPRRRSVQTALWLIARTLSRALAPILSFTSEETWQTLHQQGLLTSEDEPTSVFLNGWPMLPDIEGPDLHLYRALRRELNESAEKARQAGIIKGLTDAHAVLSLRPGRLEFNTDDETLASIFGVASLSVNSRTAVNDGIRVERRAIGDKCPRCWITRPLEADGLCRRCAEAERIVAGSVAP